MQAPLPFVGRCLLTLLGLGSNPLVCLANADVPLCRVDAANAARTNGVVRGRRTTNRYFFASVAETYSEQVQSALLQDAEAKGWQLSSVLRLGTSYVMTLTKNNRMLDVRLTNTVKGVDVVYSVLVHQQPQRP